MSTRERVSAGSGSKGERLYDWTLIRGWEEDGWSHGLLVRRSIEEQLELAYYWFYAPTHMANLETLVRVANAGKSSKPSRPPKANADWITTRSANGKDGTGTLLWPC